MINRQKDLLFQYLANQFDPNVQNTLISMYNNYKIIEQDNRKRELEDLKNSIAEEVLSRISLSTDVEKAIENIEILKRALDSLSHS